MRERTMKQTTVDRAEKRYKDGRSGLVYGTCKACGEGAGFHHYQSGICADCLKTRIARLKAMSIRDIRKAILTADRLRGI